MNTHTHTQIHTYEKQFVRFSSQTNFQQGDGRARTSHTQIHFFSSVFLVLSLFIHLILLRLYLTCTLACNSCVRRSRLSEKEPRYFFFLFCLAIAFAYKFLFLVVLFSFRFDFFFPALGWCWIEKFAFFAADWVSSGVRGFKCAESWLRYLMHAPHIYSVLREF